MRLSKKYLDTLNGDQFEWTPYLLAKSKRCHDETWMRLQDLGEIPEERLSREWCLHHIDPTMKYFDLSRYAEWRLEDVVPMTTASHLKLHKDFEKREAEYGFLSQLMMLRAKML